MPRQSRGPAPRRPTAAPAPRQAPTPQQTRSASTSAAPPATQQRGAAPPATQSQGPGLFGQMASTAAGVAVGSSIGHAIGGMFGGGSSAPAEQAEAPVDQYAANNTGYAAQQQPAVCATDVNNFRSCMDQNQGNLTICGWYLDQLKACQSAASQH